MFPGIRKNRWYHLVIVLTGLVLIDSTGIVRRVNLRGPALETAVADLVQENTTN